MPEQVDVLIIGAGISGVGMAYRLQERLPKLTYAIAEARAVSGGTWDLFRYPGVRSDSDMFTLSYPFKPWEGKDAIAEGGDILDYLRETADENGISDHISTNTRSWTPTGRPPIKPGQ
ncbi:MAG: NAD(P)/FAD-dependent oxidoreductase [Marmoricola sp.]